MSLLYSIMSENKTLSSPLQLSPQPTLRISKSERTRTAILNAALDFVWTHPFRDMTVNSLMAPTGVGRSAFYQYFKDLQEVMEALLDILQADISEASAPWIVGVGDPVALLHETLAGVVRVCYTRGPLLRAIADAATFDERFEKAWNQFLGGFDNASCERIEEDQKQGLIPAFDARPVAVALTRLDAYTILEAFGQHPRKQPEPVLDALSRIRIATLYGNEWLGKESSSLIRT
jgi:AcrR family transcriptional regulator